MKILHVSQMYYPAIGGNENHIRELSEKLAELGEDVTVFTSDALCRDQFTLNSEKTKLPLEERINKVNIRRFPVYHRLYRVLFKIIPGMRGGYRLSKMIFNDALNLLSEGPFMPQIVWSIVKFKPDLVMALNSGSCQTYYCYLAKKIKRFPLVIIPCLHIGYKWTEGPMIYKVMKFSDLILVLTEYEKEFLIGKGIEPKKIAVIGVGINPTNFTSSDGWSFRKKFQLTNEPIIAFIGRMTEGKGINTLIDSMKYIWEAMPEVRLVLAGTNTIYKEAIKKNIMALGSAERKKIICIEDFDNKERSDIFDSCDIFAMPSRAESFGIVYLEAWIHGKPVIACKDTAPSTIISDGEDGLLVEYGNKVELANAIIRLLKEEKMRKEFGEKGKKKVLKNYTWDIIANKFRQKYYELANEKNKLDYGN